MRRRARLADLEYRLEVATTASKALMDERVQSAALRVCGLAQAELDALVATVLDDTLIDEYSLEVVETAVKRAERVSDLYTKVWLRA